MANNTTGKGGTHAATLTRRALTALIAICLATIGLAASAPPSAAAADMTLDQFVATYDGKYLDVDGVPAGNPYQCVDVFKQYDRRVIGGDGPPTGGDGGAHEYWDSFTSNLASRYEKVDRSQPALRGDVAVWAKSLPGSYGYGHVAIVLEASTSDSSSLRVIQQNPGTTRIGTQSKAHLLGYLRPKNHPGPGFSGSEIAFQANTTHLWTVGEDARGNWGLGMMAGTSPSIAVLPTGGYLVAFQANTGNLWVVGAGGASGPGDTKYGMARGTSPSITALAGGGWEVAFQANTGSLWAVGSHHVGDMHAGMASGTSPTIAGLRTGGYMIAFQANTGNLWVVGAAGASGPGDTKNGMARGTSPSITALPGG
ncbi:MAG: CHAP domain-containing protein, partial [Micropruina sp.]|uniref:CHAP domain-containing protein n=1 Tax=Micropruina sp. TaxID=2737536 RepID=UPI0039E485B1